MYYIKNHYDQRVSFKIKNDVIYDIVDRDTACNHTERDLIVVLLDMLLYGMME
jgi:hypothetical protein